MTAPVVNPVTRTPLDPAARTIAARFLKDGDLCRSTVRRIPGQLWERLAERAEARS